MIGFGAARGCTVVSDAIALDAGLADAAAFTTGLASAPDPTNPFHSTDMVSNMVAHPRAAAATAARASDSFPLSTPIRSTISSRSG